MCGCRVSGYGVLWVTCVIWNHHKCGSILPILPISPKSPPSHGTRTSDINWLNDALGSGGDSRGGKRGRRGKRGRSSKVANSDLISDPPNPAEGSEPPKSDIEVVAGERPGGACPSRWRLEPPKAFGKKIRSLFKNKRAQHHRPVF